MSIPTLRSSSPIAIPCRYARCGELRAAEHRRRRELGERFAEPRDSPALVIDRRPKSADPGERMELGGQRDQRTELDDVAAKQDHSAHGVAFQKRPRGTIERWAGNPTMKSLPARTRVVPPRLPRTPIKRKAPVKSKTGTFRATFACLAAPIGAARSHPRRRRASCDSRSRSRGHVGTLHRGRRAHRRRQNQPGRTARRCARRALVLEEGEENPFLRKFYESPEKYAFAAQIFFLLSRYRQQSELAQRDLFEQAMVAGLFLLERPDFRPSEPGRRRVCALPADLSAARTHASLRPDLVVYLEARGDVLARRMRRRDRDYERRIAPAYLERVAEAYRQFFYHYTESPAARRTELRHRLRRATRRSGRAA